MKYSKLFHAFYEHFRCVSGTLTLAVCWLAGFVLGAGYGHRAAEGYVILIRVAAVNRISIAGLICALYIPLLLFALAVYVKQPRFLLLICFCKAFLFASCGSALYLAFGSAGWLVRFLLQFSDLCTIPFLYWFCMRNIRGRSDNTRFDFWVCSISAAIIGLIDFYVISPFLVTLIDI